MVRQRKNWRVREFSSAQAEAAGFIARSLGVSRAFSRVLAGRGFASPQEARLFLEPEAAGMHDPFLLRDMEVAVERIIRAAKSGETVLVYGDYDADGVTGVAILVSCLQKLGARVNYYVPNRLEEGYGLHLGPLLEAAARGVSLVITVDCGMASVEEVGAATRAGLEVIITDHHRPADRVPAARCVLNPRVEGAGYPFVELSGSGLALKLVHAVEMRTGLSQVEECVDLAALGTIADVAPLVGENRTIARLGLALLSRGERVGLEALVGVARLGDGPISAEAVSFAIAPRLNALGRLGNATGSVRLLLTKSRVEAWELAAQMEDCHRERQRLEAAVLSEAVRMIESGAAREKDGVIVLYDPQWHGGVVGIVAARLAEMYNRPALLLTSSAEGARGSARSASGFDVLAALRRCEHLLLGLGGHEGAAGVLLEETNILALREALCETPEAELLAGDRSPRLDVDDELGPEEISAELAAELERMQPHGTGNPRPLFLCRGMSIRECRVVGKRGEHLKLRVGRGDRGFDAVWFGKGRMTGFLKPGERVDLVFALEGATWKGEYRFDLVVEDMRGSGG